MDFPAVLGLKISSLSCYQTKQNNNRYNLPEISRSAKFLELVLILLKGLFNPDVNGNTRPALCLLLNPVEECFPVSFTDGDQPVADFDTVPLDTVNFIEGNDK